MVLLVKMQRHIFRLVVASVALLLPLSLVSAQVPIPTRRMGVFLTGDDASPVRVELVVDPLCSDSESEYYMWKEMISENARDDASNTLFKGGDV